MKHLLTYKLYENKVLDNILDIISNSGKESLTDDELNYLKQFSEDNIDIDLEKRLSINGGETFISKNNNIPDLTFTYENTEDFGDELIHKGKLTFNGNDYFGVINCDGDGNFVSAEFYLNEPDEYHDEMGNDLYYDAEGLEHELDQFFTDDVCSILK